MTRKSTRALLTIAALSLLALPPAQAQNQANVARIEYVPANSHPPLPAGLQLACIQIPGSGAPPSQSCPVVKYQGITTWPYSFSDNRPSLALVSYDAQNKVVRNAEKHGARYAFDATSSIPNKTVTFVGQGQQFITVPWSELGAAPK